MEIDITSIAKLLHEYSSYDVESFNIFGRANDGLPRLICVCPDRQSARTIQSLLTIAKHMLVLTSSHRSIENGKAVQNHGVGFHQPRRHNAGRNLFE